MAGIGEDAIALCEAAIESGDLYEMSADWAERKQDMLNGDRSSDWTKGRLGSSGIIPHGQALVLTGDLMHSFEYLTIGNTLVIHLKTGNGAGGFDNFDDYGDYWLETTDLFVAKIWPELEPMFEEMRQKITNMLIGNK